MKKIIHIALIFFISLVAARLSHAQTLGPQRLVELLVKNSSNGQVDRNALCAESGVNQTLRMNNGDFCNNHVFGTYALLLCLNYSRAYAETSYLKPDELPVYQKLTEDFDKSRCAEYAKSFTPNLDTGIMLTLFARAVTEEKNRPNSNFGDSMIRIICDTFPTSPSSFYLEFARSFKRVVCP